MSKMKIIGLTGGIATGKSTVAKRLAALGARIIDADHIARELVLPGLPALGEIVASFGQEMLKQDGTLDRAALGRIIFANEDKRHTLDQIMLPKIREQIELELATFRQMGKQTVILDAPLLFEAQINHLVHKTWVVYLPPHMQLERLIQRDKLSEREATQRIASQMPINIKKDLADVVIDNSGLLKDTYKQIDELWSQVMHN